MSHRRRSASAQRARARGNRRSCASRFAKRAFERVRPAIRFAHTSPFYLAVGEGKRTDPEAARFFVQWIDELTARVERNRANFRRDGDVGDLVEIYRRARAIYEAMAR